MTDERRPAIPAPYWASPSRLLAGPHPLALAADGAAAIDEIRRVGVDKFVDLTAEGEAPDYDALLGEASRVRLPMRDLATPSVDRIAVILDEIDAQLEAGRVLYVHCLAGLGRTGTVVGCWLVRHGVPGELALRRLAELRAEAGDGFRSPETRGQRARVRRWRIGS